MITLTLEEYKIFLEVALSVKETMFEAAEFGKDSDLIWTDIRYLRDQIHNLKYPKVQENNSNT